MRTIAARYVDRFVLALLLTVVFATLLPAQGGVLHAVDHVSTAAVCLLFFLHGTKLSTADTVAGVRQWRLHTLVFATTFVIFPLLGLATRGLVPAVLTHQLWIGVVFLCVLPSTVQSSIAFTSIARGNVAGAVVSASASNILGVVLTPALLALLIGSSVGISGSSLLTIAAELVLPFVLGQLARPYVRPFLTRHKPVVGLVDRSSVLLVVYAAFSAGVNQGVWHQLPVGRLLALAGVCGLLLALLLTGTWWISGRLGFTRGDRIVAVFCGSKKSLVSGLPMASVLFPTATLAITVMPLMIFHMTQLIVCAVLARRWSGGAGTPDPEPSAPQPARAPLPV